jgi:hypothetical protein
MERRKDRSRAETCSDAKDRATAKQLTAKTQPPCGRLQHRETAEDREDQVGECAEDDPRQQQHRS